MDQLAAVNLMLRLSGQAGVNSISSGDQKSNEAAEVLEANRREILEKPFQFNHLKTDFAVNADGKVPVPMAYLAVQLPKACLAPRLDTDDNKLYVWNLDDDDWEDSKVEDVIVTYDIENYQAIPQAFMLWIAYAAAADYRASKEGNPSQWLIYRLNRARANALNSLPAVTIHSVTGFYTLRSYLVA